MSEFLVPVVVVCREPVRDSFILRLGYLIFGAPLGTIIFDPRVIAPAVSEYVAEVFDNTEISAGGIGGGDEDSLLS